MMTENTKNQDPENLKTMQNLVVRRSIVVRKKRSEIETLLTRARVEQFLKDLGKGAIDAEVSREIMEPDAKLGLGDTVTVRLTQLEFAGLAGLVQMVAAAKAPPMLKPYLEKSKVFASVGSSLDRIYSSVRGSLTFKSKITDWHSTADELVYIDEGQDLPKVLNAWIKSWKHTHRIADQGEGSLVVDEIAVEVEPAFAVPAIEAALNLHLKRYHALFAAADQ